MVLVSSQFPISIITFLFVEIQELLESIRDNFGMVLYQDNFTFGNQLEAEH